MSGHRLLVMMALIVGGALPAAAAQLFPSAKSAAIRVIDLPSGQNLTDFCRWVGQHYDLVASSGLRMDLLRQANPGIKLFRYNFVNGVYEDFIDPPRTQAHYFESYYRSFNYCAQNQLNWEDWFIHYGQDAIINPSNQRAAYCSLDRFHFVRTYSAGVYADRRTQAYSTTAGDLPFGKAVGDILYVGHPTIFGEINFTLSAVGAGWSGAWEYWNGSGWAPLPVTDGTQSMTRSGKVSFFPPPSNWRQTTVSGQGVAYWVRLRTVSSGSSAPVASAIRGEQFARDTYDAYGNWLGIRVPGWDSANDLNGDGIRDTNADPSATARFRWQARVLAKADQGGILYMLNLPSQTVRQWIIDHDVSVDPTPWDGPMYDVVDGKWMYLGNPVGSVSVVEYPGDSATRASAWADDVTAYLGYAQTRYYALGKLVGGNTSYGYHPEIDAELGWALREGWWGSLSSNWEFENEPEGFFDPTAIWRQAQASGKFNVLQFQMVLANKLGDYPQVWSRDKLLALATFYLGQQPATDYFNAWYGFYYGPDAAKYYVPAIQVDIGAPAPAPQGTALVGTQGAYIFATGKDTTVSDGLSKYRVYARRYTKGLVLVKPCSDRVTSVGTVGGVGDNTATTHLLPGVYFPVRADGSLGAAVDRVTLRNAEGAILVKASLAPGIAGTVKDMQTMAAISGATVQVSQSGTVVATVTTDASGFYSAALSAGTYNLVGSASGHASTWIGGVSVTAGNTTMMPDILLSQSRFQGAVTNAATGSPIGGATVKGIQGGVVKYSTTTSAAGNYWLNLVPGSYMLEVSQSGYRTQSRASSVVAGQVKIENLTLPPPGIAGTVKDMQTLAPLSGAGVQILQSGTVVAFVTTNSSGFYSAPLPAGTYDLVGSASGHTATWLGGVSVTAGNAAMVDFLLSQSRFQGAVTAPATGLPIAGATVKALQGGVEKYSTTSSGAGNYWLNLVPGSYTLEASQSGYRTMSRASIVSAGQVKIENLTLPPPGIAGTVKDMQTLAPLSGAGVQISQSGTVVTTVTTNSSGFYSAALPAGTYDLVGFVAGHAPTWIGGVSVTAGNTALADILLSQSRFQGAVTDAATGSPIAGATVKGIQGGVVKYSTTTSGAGNYWLNLVPGSYTLEVSKSGYGTQRRVDSLAAAQVKVYNLGLAPPGIAGTVKDMQTLAPLSGAGVQILQSGTVVAFVTTNSSGFYSAPLPAGTYDLVGSASGHTATWIGGMSVTTGNTTVVDIFLSQSRFQGQVTDAATGSPVAGATVKGIQGGVVKYSTTTSAAGNYWLNLVPGSYTLQVSKSGYTTQSRVDSIVAGQVKVDNFSL